MDAMDVEGNKIMGKVEGDSSDVEGNKIVG